MGGWLRNDPVRRTVHFVAGSGREYLLTIVRAVRLTEEEVPAVMVEHPDGSIFFGGRSFASIDEACREFGCVLIGFEGAALEN